MLVEQLKEKGFLAMICGNDNVIHSMVIIYIAHSLKAYLKCLAGYNGQYLWTRKCRFSSTTAHSSSQGQGRVQDLKDVEE